MPWALAGWHEKGYGYGSGDYGRRTDYSRPGYGKEGGKSKGKGKFERDRKARNWIPHALGHLLKRYAMIFNAFQCI